MAVVVTAATVNIDAFKERAISPAVACANVLQAKNQDTSDPLKILLHQGG